MKKKIVILGSTGSVGKNVLDVVAHHPDRFDVVGLASGRNVASLLEQTRVHSQALVTVDDATARDRLVAEDPRLQKRLVQNGSDSIRALIEQVAPDLVVNCLVGFVGLAPTLHALESGIPVALANKEAVVTGGELVMRKARESGVDVIPIDSEHVAISQCLRGSDNSEVKTIYITASGGALRSLPLGDIANASVEDVLAHPTWNMGDKITVDSATLLNKGLEVIEAHWLFDMPFDKIRVVIHPQSIVHSMVEFKDNSITAQMGVPDMRLPILYALTYPERVETGIAPSDVTRFPELGFMEVEKPRYPCLALAFAAAEAGGNAPTILNSANELAVGAFLARKIPFSHIYEMIQGALEAIPATRIDSFDDVLETDRSTRAYIKKKFAI